MDVIKSDIGVIESTSHVLTTYRSITPDSGSEDQAHENIVHVLMPKVHSYVVMILMDVA